MKTHEELLEHALSWELYKKKRNVNKPMWRLRAEIRRKENLLNERQKASARSLPRKT